MRTCKIMAIVLFALAAQDSYAQNDAAEKKLYHVLLFKWADSLNVQVQSEVFKLFEGLPEKVDGFESIEILSLSKSSDGFDTVVVQEFESEEALKRYEEHPDHLRISEIGPPLLSGFAQFDYWK